MSTSRLAKFKSFAQSRGATSLFSTAVITGHSIPDLSMKPSLHTERLIDCNSKSVSFEIECMHMFDLKFNYSFNNSQLSRDKFRFFYQVPQHSFP